MISSDMGSGDVILAALSAYGIYDLGVTEVLWRLIEPGETVADVGANICYMTSIMAARVSSTGRVFGFEPNPGTYSELQANVQAWQQMLGWDFIELYRLAISNRDGTGILSLDVHNRGEASLISVNENQLSSTDKRTSYQFEVPLARLDGILTTTEAIDVLKIDVEGHELAVLQGSTRFLDAGQIRDIIFEEHRQYPTPVTTLLANRDYHVYKIDKGFCGPRLTHPTQLSSHPWEPTSYLATLEPERAQRLISGRGWYSLQDLDLSM